MGWLVVVGALGIGKKRSRCSRQSGRAHGVLVVTGWDGSAGTIREAAGLRTSDGLAVRGAPLGELREPEEH